MVGFELGLMPDNSANCATTSTYNCFCKLDYKVVVEE